MRKLYIMFFIFSILLFGVVSADATYYEEDYDRSLTTDSSFVEVTKLRYESYPVSPGDYFTLYIQVQKTGSEKVDVDFELLEEYPFFLDSNEDAARFFDNLNNEPVVLEYKIRVDDNAVSGENILKIRQGGSGASIIREFDIMVEDVQTSFDAVVQENLAGEVSIALANIGLNDAGALIVKIPEQEGLRASGTNGQMVGNLEQGDYTVVGFTVTGMSPTLKMQVDYTDAIGIRRSELIEMPFSSKGESSDVATSSSRTGMRPNQRVAQQEDDSGSFGGWMTWLVGIFIVLVLVFVGNKYFRKQKNTQGISSNVPDWMKKKKGAKK